MRCRYCRERAGWWRRECEECRRLLGVVSTHRGADMRTIMVAMSSSGVSSEKVERFLNAEPKGQAALRDQIAADMTNQLMDALGQRGRQTAGDVKRIRERGTWVRLDRRPED